MHFDETGRNCRMVLDLPEIGTVRGFDVKTINGVPYIFALGVVMLVEETDLSRLVIYKHLCVKHKDLVEEDGVT